MAENKEIPIWDFSTTEPITDAERRRRQDAVNFARASLALSGFKSDALTEELSRQFVNGEISIDEAIKATHASAHEP